MIQSQLSHSFQLYNYVPSASVLVETREWQQSTYSKIESGKIEAHLGNRSGYLRGQDRFPLLAQGPASRKKLVNSTYRGREPSHHLLSYSQSLQAQWQLLRQ